MQNTTKSSVYLDRRAHQRLIALRETYKEKGCRKPSASHIIRRALTLLASYLKRLEDEEAWAAELVALKAHRKRHEM